MNESKSLVIPDLDQHIIGHLTPPSVLCLRQVNHYYLNLLEVHRSHVLCVKTDLVKACEYGYLWIAKWIFNSRLSIVKKISDFVDSMNKLDPDLACISSEYIARMKIRTTETKTFFSTTYDVVLDETMFNEAFNAAISNFHLDVIYWFLSIDDTTFGKIDIQPGLFWMGLYVSTNGLLESAKRILEVCENKYERIDIHKEDEHVFRNAVESGHIDFAKWLISIGEQSYGKINIHAADEYAFIKACGNNDIHMAQWLISLGENGYGKINIHVDNEIAFRLTCIRNENLPILQWLIDLGEKSYGKIDIDVNANDYWSRDDSAFSFACRSLNFKIVKWLLELSIKYNQKIHISESNMAYIKSSNDIEFTHWFFNLIQNGY